jgi:hypothetical protein
MRIYKAKDGEWLQPKNNKGFVLGCCDCLLTHIVDFRIVKDKIQFRAFRKVRLTAARRRKNSIKIARN